VRSDVHSRIGVIERSVDGNRYGFGSTGSLLKLDIVDGRDLSVKSNPRDTNAPGLDSLNNLEPRETGALFLPDNRRASR